MGKSLVLSLAGLTVALGVLHAQDPTPAEAPPPRPAPVVTGPEGAGPAPTPPPPDVAVPAGPFGSGAPPAPRPLACQPACCACDRFWFNAEYLLWWTKDNHLPAVLTAGDATDRRPGALGQPGTQVLLGGDIGNGDRSGARFALGYWFTDDHVIGAEANFLFLDRSTKAAGASSDGNPVLAEPFYNANTEVAGAYRLAFPGRRSGTYAAALDNELWGTELNLRSAVFQTRVVQVQLLAGFRYLELEENFRTLADTLGTANPDEGEIITSQHFGTRNYFYGGQVGAETTLMFGRLTVDFTGKVALGATHEVALINGSTVLQGPTIQTTTLPLAEYAMPSNIGRYSRDMFTVVPEAGVTLGYQVTRHMRATLGYTFLYMSNAVRPGDLIDTTVNPSQIRNALTGTPVVGALRPAFPGGASDFWAQGLNFGLEFRY
jgi:hypothetical protein